MVILLLSFCVISNHSTVFGASAMWQAYDGWQGYKNKHIPTLYFLRSYSLVTASSSSEESAGLVKVKVLVAQSCLALCNPMDYNQPGSSVHGILQPRMLRWVAIPFSRGSSPPRKRARSPELQADSLPSEPPGKPTSLICRSIMETLLKCMVWDSFSDKHLKWVQKR